MVGWIIPSYIRSNDSKTDWECVDITSIDQNWDNDFKCVNQTTVFDNLNRKAEQLSKTLVKKS